MTRDDAHPLDRRIRRAIADLGSAAISLGTLHGENHVSYERLTYVRMILTPNHRLGASLMTSRDLLVLVSAEPELHGAVIGAIKLCLEELSGRVEPRVVMVMHFDPRGDQKLKFWGREQGLTILSLYAGDGIPVGDALESSLCRELYSHDPFDLAGPVRDESQFFGRPDIPDLARRLRQGQIRSLFGLRKIGKTSVLNKILREARVYHDSAVVIADLSVESLASLDAGQLMNSIGGAILEAVSVPGRYASTFPIREEVSLEAAGDTLLRTICQAECATILLIDEVDSICPGNPLSEHWRDQFNPFFRRLRYVYQESCRLDIQFSLVICGVSSRWFAIEEINGAENSALALVPEDYLGPFEREQSIDMIRLLGLSAGLKFTMETAEIIAETCGDIPFWIRRAGSYIHTTYPQQGRPFTPEPADVRKLCAEFVEIDASAVAFPSLRHLFRIYPELGPVAVACLENRARELPQQYLSALGRYGILGDALNISGPLMAAGIKLWSHEYADRVAFEIPPSAPTPSSDDPLQQAPPPEWSELIGEVARMRNELERKTRDFVLNVLRMHCASRGDAKKPSELILASVPVENRERLSGKAAQAILKEFFWLDLANVIKRQWRAFESYFGDKRKFEDNAEIVNWRPDAHAKDMDIADLALQRRAINWLLEGVESLD